MESGRAQGKSSSFRKGRWNIAHKITAVALLVGSTCLAVTLIAVVFVAARQINVLSSHHYAEMSEILANEISGAVKWRNEGQLQGIYDEMVAKEDPLLHGFTVVAGEGDSRLFFTRQLELDDAGLSDLLAEGPTAEALEGYIETDSSMVFQIPVLSGKDKSQVGTLLVGWDLHESQAVVFDIVKWTVVIAVGLFVVYGVLMYLFSRRSIVSRLRHNVAVANRIAAGDLSKEIRVTSGDELGELDFALRGMQESLRASDDSERRALEFGRIKKALDAASSATMLADQDDQIVYVNDAVKTLFADNADLFDGCSIDPENIIGQSISGLTCIADLTLDDLHSLESQRVEEISRAGHTMRVSVSPVADENNQRIGSVFEWKDRTHEVSAEQQLRALVDAAASGDFSKRIDDAGMEGFYKQVAGMLNSLAQISEDGLNDVLRVLRALAAGDLSERIEKEYEGLFGELKESCNITSDKIREIVGRIREAAAEVNQGATEISRGNMDLSNRTEEQAASLERTASAMEEMTATVQQNSDNANQANSLSDEAHQQAVRGGEVANRAVSAVGEISEASRKIADINGVIDEIAFQTNLLALNASVEAARAGELGRGFAVVASEVRNLAGRSAQAAREIKELIEDSVSKVAEGERLVAESGEALNAIVGSVKQVSDIVNDIASASSEQAAGIGQINLSITQIDETTQQNSALVEQAAAASQTVSNQARELDELVSFFQLGAAGNSASFGVSGMAATSFGGAGATAMSSVPPAASIPSASTPAMSAPSFSRPTTMQGSAPSPAPAASPEPAEATETAQAGPPDGVERRSAERPWSAPPAAAPAAAVQAAAANDGESEFRPAAGDDSDWEEF